MILSFHLSHAAAGTACARYTSLLSLKGQRNRQVSCFLFLIFDFTVEISGTMQLVAPLLVSVLLMAGALHTAANSQDLSLASNWLGDVASNEPRGFESSAGQICDATLGECNYDEEEFAMDSEAHGRLLRRIRYYISYGALAANRVPCRPRSGRSYYTHNCYGATGPVRPYRRSCTAITRCRRYTG